MDGIQFLGKRLYNPELLIDPTDIFNDGKILRDTDPNTHGNSPMYEIHWTGATQAGEELGTAATSAKDGTTTPYLVNIVSSDVADDWDNLAGAVRSVALVGITTNSIAGDGVVLSGAFTGFDQANNTDPDLNTEYHTYTSRGGSVSNEGKDTLSRKTTINSKVLWSEALIANSIVYDIHIIQSVH